MISAEETRKLNTVRLSNRAEEYRNYIEQSIINVAEERYEVLIKDYPYYTWLHRPYGNTLGLAERDIINELRLLGYSVSYCLDDMDMCLLIKWDKDYNEPIIK